MSFAATKALQLIASRGSRAARSLPFLGGAAAAGIAVLFGNREQAEASDDCVPSPKHPWSHKGYISAFDSASLRRGFEVYRNVCSTCHSMELVHYRELVGVTHTEVQAKALAESIEVKDGPDENGKMFDRPGKLSDSLPSPYENKEEAMALNGGAYPPDMSCLCKARPAGEDYIFALLTGYKDPPAGIQLREGLHYNPYFGGGAIAMAKPLSDEMVEYEDGTVATESQMAKDVSTFLAWASEPETDRRKRMGLSWITATAVMFGVAGYYKKYKFSIYKTQRYWYVK